MKIECKKTTDLSELEIKQYCSCFSNIFEGQSRSVELFNNEYLNSSLGYSYHVLLKNDENIVVGAYSASPFYYVVNGATKLFASGADFMIEKEYRNDIRNVVNLIRQTEEYLKANHVVCLYGFPNEYSYKLNISLMRMKAVTTLNTYILPLRIGDAKDSLKIFNLISWIGCKTLLFMSYLNMSKKEIVTKIHRKRPDFDTFRYKWFNPHDYKTYRGTDFSCVWKISQYRGTKACFLMDVYPFSKNNFEKSVRRMLIEEGKNVGLFIYISSINFMPISMIKVPQRLNPKTIRFVVKILDKEETNKNTYYYGKNWDLNFSSYDLL